MATPGMEPSRILDLGMGFQQSKTLLSAVELDLFSHLGARSMTGEEIGARVGLHSRVIYEFLDALVAMRVLERDGDGTEGRYRNGVEASAFLDDNSAAYIGGFLKMINARAYHSWGRLTEALKTGTPQNEVKQAGKNMFHALYSDPTRLEQFTLAMSGVTAGPAHALADTFDFSRYQTVCDVGGAMGQQCIALARRCPHLRCMTFDLPVVAPLAQTTVDAAGLADRVTVLSGDFFADPLPRADVITMARILHDWNLEGKKKLMRAAHDALPDGGAFVVMESLIDDARRENVFALMASLHMLIEFGEGFDFTGRDFAGWAYEIGFRYVEIRPLAGPMSVAIAHK